MNKIISSKARNEVMEEGHRSRMMIHRTSTGVLGCLLPVSLQEQYLVIISFESLRKKR
jgi:hypothetical protein